MVALSNLAALLFSFALVANATPVVQPTPDAETVFAVYPGWDMDNGVVETILNDTEFACLRACSSSSSCVAYTYLPYGFVTFGFQPTCILKDTIDLSTFTLQSVDLSVGIVGACGTLVALFATKLSLIHSLL
ncbi:hypothetical protein B0H19DRAFT_1070848 [Mycena capillaripes]|nr:hypothetical protein B0H19DRAFT_1070848 [Mycena capillaripes]